MTMIMKNFSFYCIVAICFAFIAFSVTGCDIETEPNEENGGNSQYSSFNLAFFMNCKTTVTMAPSQVFTLPSHVENDLHLHLSKGPKKFTNIIPKLTGIEYIYEHIAKHTYEGMPVGDFDITKYVVKIFMDNYNYANLEYYEKRDRKAGDRKDEHIVEVKCNQIPFKEKKWDSFVYSLNDIPVSKVDYFFAQDKTSKQSRVETHELLDKDEISGQTNCLDLYLNK